MLEQIILGAIQGISEWLPVSSEGLIFLVKTNFFHDFSGIRDLAEDVLFLHLGTFLSALIYFRKDVWKILKTCFKFKKSSEGNRKLVVFLLISTLISGIFGFGLLLALDRVGGEFTSATKSITILIGVLLLITAYLQIKAESGGGRKGRDIKKRDGIILGFVQGLAAMPGLSRSGLTVSALLLGNFNKETALKLSFLMSLPIVLAGNLILNLDKFALSITSLAGLLTSFIFGILTIDLLLKLSRKINFGYFVLFFGVVTIISVLI